MKKFYPTIDTRNNLHLAYSLPSCLDTTDYENHLFRDKLTGEPVILCIKPVKQGYIDAYRDCLMAKIQQYYDELLNEYRIREDGPNGERTYYDDVYSTYEEAAAQVEEYEAEDADDDKVYSIIEA